MAHLLLYDFRCTRCGMVSEHYTPYVERRRPFHCACGGLQWRTASPVKGKVRGRADGKDPDNSDQFTADVLNVKLRDLPSGLRNKK